MGAGLEGRLPTSEANRFGILECEEDALEVVVVGVILPPPILNINCVPGRGGSGGFGAGGFGGKGRVV